eukprot:194960-Chlamydomonas_euryale.AAC.11
MCASAPHLPRLPTPANAPPCHVSPHLRMPPHLPRLPTPANAPHLLRLPTPANAPHLPRLPMTANAPHVFPHRHTFCTSVIANASSLFCSVKFSTGSASARDTTKPVVSGTATSCAMYRSARCDSSLLASASPWMLSSVRSWSGSTAPETCADEVRCTTLDSDLG